MKGNTLLVVIVVIALVLVGGGGAYWSTFVNDTAPAMQDSMGTTTPPTFQTGKGETTSLPSTRVIDPTEGVTFMLSTEWVWSADFGGVPEGGQKYVTSKDFSGFKGKQEGSYIWYDAYLPPNGDDIDSYMVQLESTYSAPWQKTVIGGKAGYVLRTGGNFNAVVFWKSGRAVAIAHIQDFTGGSHFPVLEHMVSTFTVEPRAILLGEYLNALPDPSFSEQKISQGYFVEGEEIRYGSTLTDGDRKDARVVVEADSSSFYVVDDGVQWSAYAVDATRVYCKGNVVAGADPLSVEVSGDEQYVVTAHINGTKHTLNNRDHACRVE